MIWVLDLPREFVVTTWNRKDDGTLPSNCFSDRFVSGRIAGVQRNAQVDWRVGCMTGDVTLLEREPPATKFFSQSLAILDHGRFQIEPNDLHVAAQYIGEKVMQCERQVASPASKVHNADLTVGWEMFHNVVDDVEVPVDLPKFFLSRRPNLTALRHDSCRD